MTFTHLATHYPKIAQQLLRYLREPDNCSYQFDDSISVETLQVFKANGVKLLEFYIAPDDRLQEKEINKNTYFLSNIVSDYNELNLWIADVERAYSKFVICTIETRDIENNRIEVKLSLYN